MDRIFYDYALALVQVNRFEEAQKSVEAALCADGDLSEAHELRGGLIAPKRQLSEAAREYQRALELRIDFSRR